ncbi:MAG: hypothetical protein BWY42_00143 [Candidatus Omnitrophica bacterium ADurb.Bin277]|nr:MAG: hypothetical protein BWY42_00143 [Candidatus Omnitrophica bacterium ADurb.Bin277]
MFLFLKLVLAHLTADFFLQFEELYQLKVRRFLGHFLHIAIHGAVAVLLAFPYLTEPLILAYIIFLTLEHLLQDIIKYKLTRKFPAGRFIYYVTDQFFHFAVIALVLFFPAAHEARAIKSSSFLNWLYLDPAITLFPVFFILLTFAANYTLNSFYQSYLKGSRPLHWISSPEMTVAIIERSVIALTLIVTRSPFWGLFSLAIGLIRLPFKNLRSRNDFLVSVSYTVILTFIFLRFL